MAIRHIDGIVKTSIVSHGSISFRKATTVIIIWILVYTSIVVFSSFLNIEPGVVAFVCGLFLLIMNFMYCIYTFHLMYHRPRILSIV